MAKRIGFLLPRSTDYPAMAFDLLDGLRIYLRNNGYADAQFISENIGFGDDLPNVYARAEKLIMQDDADVIVIYTNPQNADVLYPLAESSGKPFIFLDAGMQFANENVPANCTHISLQGLSCCRHMGRMAAKDNRKALFAVSFFDAGFRCSMASIQGVEESNGTVAGNFVSAHKISEFNVDRFMELMRETKPDAVIANFSIYLTELFTTALKNAGEEALSAPFYCGPFMFEEQVAAKCDFPGGTWYTTVPWHSAIENEAQKVFTASVLKEKNKAANIFHLLGWEAGIAVQQLDNTSSLAGSSYESPRGTVTIHPKTLTSYAPVYTGTIEANAQGKCTFRPSSTIAASDKEHTETFSRTMEMNTGWRNNYFCT